MFLFFCVECKLSILNTNTLMFKFYQKVKVASMILLPSFYCRFINAIIEEFRAHAHKLDVATILTRVNNNVSKCRAKYGKWESPTNHEKFSNINQLLFDFYLNPMAPLKGYKLGKVLEE